MTLPDGIELSADELAFSAQHFHGTDRGRVRMLPEEACYTTRIQLEREQQVLNAVTIPALVSVDPNRLEEAIRRWGLVAEQADAMRHLAELRGRVVAVVGPGGSGKTFAIGAYVDAVQAGGHRVVGVATSAAAARKLSEDVGAAWTGTIAMMRHQLETAHTPLPGGTVIIVDEASMVSTRDLAWLVEQAGACSGKVVLMGDPKQLPSIDSGGLFHRIVADGHGVVTNLAGVNERQTLELDRNALDHLRQGQVEAAVHNYAEAGRIHLGSDEYTTKAAMVESWWADAQTHGIEQVRMLASRRDEVAMLNQLARVHMESNGLLHGPGLVNRWGMEFRAGDRIVVRDNWYAHSDLRNGQTGTITAIHPNGRSLMFRRDLDGAVVELPASYVDSSVDHAYAQTIHTAQGQTFQTTHLYVDTGVAAEHGYTGLSRARGETHLWVNTRRTIDGRCIQPHGQLAVESHVESLVRQFTKSVVQVPASSQGFAVEAATDRQLHQWLGDLENVIRRGPLGRRIDVEALTRIDQALDDARTTVQRLDTSGTRAQVVLLDEERQQLLDQIELREEWVEANADLLHTYTAIKDELEARASALAISYQLNPPQDVLETLGPRPSNTIAGMRWDNTVIHHATTRISLGPAADLSDPAILEAASWRTAVQGYHPERVAERTPLLRLSG